MNDQTTLPPNGNTLPPLALSPLLIFDPVELAEDIATRFEQNTGVRLQDGDVRMALIRVHAEALAQANVANTMAYRQSFLSYATGSSIDYIGYPLGVFRRESERASVDATFRNLSDTVAAVVPEGTAISDDEGFIFTTTETKTIPASSSLDIGAIAAVAGEAYNGRKPTQVVTVLPDVAPTVGIALPSTGGTTGESDESLKERILIAPDSFSVAGPGLAYRYFALSADSSLLDVYVHTPKKGHVDVWAAVDDPRNPVAPQPILDAIDEALNRKTVVPLTDNITVKAPVGVPFTVDVGYKLTPSAVERQAEIHEAIVLATRGFANWTASVVGRDIREQELIARLIDAGARQVDITFDTDGHGTRLAPNEHDPDTAEIAFVVDLEADITVTYLGELDE